MLKCCGKCTKAKCIYNYIRLCIWEIIKSQQVTHGMTNSWRSIGIGTMAVGVISDIWNVPLLYFRVWSEKSWKGAIVWLHTYAHAYINTYTYLFKDVHVVLICNHFATQSHKTLNKICQRKINILPVFRSDLLSVSLIIQYFLIYIST